jgi:rhodanese-related sulfurtransferase
MAKTVKDMLSAANVAVPTIDQADARALIEAGNAVVVDVRDGPELAGGKVAGAIHVSRGMIEFRADPDMPTHNEAFDKSKTMILYCASGGRSALAGKVLIDMGYTDVRNLGGFQAWVDDGGAVET